MDRHLKATQPSTGKEIQSGRVYGRKRGHATKKIASRRSHREELRQSMSPAVGERIAREQVAKGIAREICGYAPYEKRALDLVKQGEDKKARKFLKKRLGSLRSAKKKQESLARVLTELQ